MPQGDKNGPMGMGPMTGRRMGLCSGNDQPGYMNAGQGYMGGRINGRDTNRGSGHGGRGFRNMLHITGISGWMRNRVNQEDVLQPEDELRGLKNRAESLVREGYALKQRIDKLERDLS